MNIQSNEGPPDISRAGLFDRLHRYWIAPYQKVVVTRYDVQSEKLPAGTDIRIAVVADIHAGKPFMPLDRVDQIVSLTNSLNADLVLIPGDLAAEGGKFQIPVPLHDISRSLAALRAPMGVHAVLGNHDWWDDKAAQSRDAGPCETAIVLADHGITTLENEALRLCADRDIWLAGLGCQTAFWRPTRRHKGAHDVDRALADIPQTALSILAAHEPDIFPQLPDHVDLTISGHTHGGQISLFGWTPVVPSKFGSRYAYGHIREAGRSLVVSGGLGCSTAPLRFGVMPEIVLITVAGAQARDGAVVTGDAPSV